MKLIGDFMGLFNIFMKKATTQREQKQQNATVKSTVVKTTAEKEKAPVDNRTWLDKYYMRGYDVGEIKGYTDLPERPRCDEEGTQDILQWSRYGNIIIITGLTIQEIENVSIPQTINGYTVAGIERMAFLHCKIRSIIIPENVGYIGGMAIGFTSKSPFSDDEEREIRALNPFAENWPTSPFMDKVFFVHQTPKTRIFCKGGTKAAYYSVMHKLPTAIQRANEDNTYYLRTVLDERHFSGGSAGHEFEATTIELIFQNEDYYLEKWFDPYPGGAGKQRCCGKVWMPKELIDKKDKELREYYNSHS